MDLLKSGMKVIREVELQTARELHFIGYTRDLWWWQKEKEIYKPGTNVYSEMSGRRQVVGSGICISQEKQLFSFRPLLPFIIAISFLDFPVLLVCWLFCQMDSYFCSSDKTLVLSLSGCDPHRPSYQNQSSSMYSPRTLFLFNHLIMLTGTPISALMEAQNFQLPLLFIDFHTLTCP